MSDELDRTPRISSQNQREKGANDPHPKIELNQTQNPNITPSGSEGKKIQTLPDLKNVGTTYVPHWMKPRFTQEGSYTADRELGSYSWILEKSKKPNSRIAKAEPPKH